MKRSLAEAVGTFVLGFGGCGSAVLAGTRWGFSGCRSPADARCWPWPRPSANLGLPSASRVCAYYKLNPARARGMKPDALAHTPCQWTST
jgi:hypothetical protein